MCRVVILTDNEIAVYEAWPIAGLLEACVGFCRCSQVVVAHLDAYHLMVCGTFDRLAIQSASGCHAWHQAAL